MKRSVVSRIPAVLLLALAATVGCGGSRSRGADTCPAPDASLVGGQEASPTTPAVAGLSEQLAQAQRVWGDSCTFCHGDQGEGKSKKTPVVVGGKALRKYRTGRDVLAFIRKNMPKDDPGNLSDADYLAVTAWLLSKNGKLGDTRAALTTGSAAGIQLQ